MRLLERKGKGEYSLTDDLISNIPPYAILSHTWRGDGDEVTFKDIYHETAVEKKGYKKIRFCGEQAAKDGLRYFWVDTCCIDKSSSAELAETINSMFMWYAEASKCYVYLSDVSNSGWRSTFRGSRYFTRGWTLPELIAPQSVEFFSTEEQKLGDKRVLESEICAATGIDASALRGMSLSEFSVEKRMSWAAKRNTTRKEDKAYCLLGIFGVHMPLIYGEGDYAFARLSEAIGKRAGGLDGKSLQQHAMRPDQYNCYTMVNHYKKRVAVFDRSLKNVRCPRCDWDYSSEKGSYAQPSVAGGRKVPYDTIWQRFHYNKGNESLFRCFICRDGRTFHWDGLKDHLEETHTYGEICN